MGSRDLTTAVKNELDKAGLQLGLFVEIIFDSGPFRVWSGLGNMTLGGNVYSGIGTLGRIDKIEESATDIRASGVALTLSGIPSALLAQTLTENYQGRQATIWLVMFDSAWQIIADPVVLNVYRLDYPQIEEGGETCSITVFAESILADLERPRVRRRTHEDQIALHAGDLGFEFVAALQNKETIWKAPG